MLSVTHAENFPKGLRQPVCFVDGIQFVLITEFLLITLDSIYVFFLESL